MAIFGSVGAPGGRGVERREIEQVHARRQVTVTAAEQMGQILRGCG